MKKEHVELIEITKKIIYNENIENSKFDFEKLYKLSIEHSMCSFIYSKIKTLEMNEKIRIKFEKNKLASILKDAKQLYYADLIIKAFNEEKIFHTLYKGMILKKLYPDSSDRLMGDIDILVKEKDLKKIDFIFKKLKFEKSTESFSHWNFSLGNLIFIEIHPNLMDEEYDTTKYFLNYEKNLILVEGHTYNFTSNFHFIYLLVHFVKHLKNGGAGYRNIVDFVYFIKNFSVDFDFIEEEMKKLNLLEFFKNLMGLIQKNYSLNLKYEINENIYENLTTLIMEGGTYGDTDSKLKIEKSVSNLYKNKFTYIFHLIFLPYKSIKYKYKILQKLPFLLPIMWLYRFFELTVLNFKSTFIKMKQLRLNKNNIKAMKEKYKNIGL